MLLVKIDKIFLTQKIEYFTNLEYFLLPVNQPITIKNVFLAIGNKCLLTITLLMFTSGCNIV